MVRIFAQVHYRGAMRPRFGAGCFAGNCGRVSEKEAGRLPGLSVDDDALYDRNAYFSAVFQAPGISLVQASSICLTTLSGSGT